jgi:hypothetical protein
MLINKKFIDSYLDLIRASLERMDADNLLEAIETYDDEAVI